MADFLPMTGSDIKHIREKKGLTLRQMAELLKDASHTTISRWEDNPDGTLPSWVAERLLDNLTVTMSASTFATLLDLARTTGLTPEELFSSALSEYAKNHRPQPPETKRPGITYALPPMPSAAPLPPIPSAPASCSCSSSS